MKHQQYDLTNVLHRPVETATQSGHFQTEYKHIYQFRRKLNVLTQSQEGYGVFLFAKTEVLNPMLIKSAMIKHVFYQT